MTETSLSKRRPDPAPAFCGAIDMRIQKDGTWLYRGSPIGRKEMVCLFASVLTRHEDGSYWLVTPSEMACIEVEDVPFLAVELFSCGSGRDRVVSLRTNIDELVTVDDMHPLRIATDPKTGEQIPYVWVRDGLEARLSRPVYYELVSLGHEEATTEGNQFGLWSSGSFFPLGSLEEA
ncbi:MAG: DUF1285 domain-containing protein [Rhodospirillales bacterium]|jgi:hypothetical protein|nr:DUF1285 domain-containing protein [Rhodospirillales bacterium]